MYEAHVTKIKNIRKHENADRLQIGECFGNSVVLGLDTKEGDLGVYFDTDGKLGLEYATKNNLLRIKNEDGTYSGGYLDPIKRKISAIRLRGEKSEGLFMPLESLADFCDITKLQNGDAITILNGIVICEKYIPVQKVSSSSASNIAQGKKKLLKAKFPFFEEHIDTKQLPYCLDDFKAGDTCYITLKMHGTSARTAMTIEETIEKQNIIKRLLRLKPTIKREYKLISGTRRVILTDFQDSFYKETSFRKKYHDFFEGKLHKGEEVFYEILGYTDGCGFIMPEGDNKLTKDKQFIKEFGEKTQFTYGCHEGENRIFVYRMNMTSEDGEVVEYPTELVQLRCEQMGVEFVPIFEKFLFTTQENLLAKVDEYVAGADPVGRTHIREGVVVRIDNKKKFTAFKMKNFQFRVIEGIIKEVAESPDMEEEQEELNEY